MSGTESYEDHEDTAVPIGGGSSGVGEEIVEPSEYSEPQLEAGILSCAARDWEIIPLSIARSFGALAKTLDLSYNQLR